MAAGGSAKSRPAAGGNRFVGQQTIATVEALDAFVRSARPGETFTYCEAPEPIRIDSWHRARELEQSGLVHLRQARRAGGGWRWWVERTARPLPRERSAQEKALDDPATAAIFAQLRREAAVGLKCSSDANLAGIAGLATRAQAQWRVRELVRLGLIASEIVTRGGVPQRVVTILPGRWAGSAAGKSTLLPGADPGSGGPRRASPSWPRKMGGCL